MLETTILKMNIKFKGCKLKLKELESYIDELESESIRCLKLIEIERLKLEIKLKELRKKPLDKKQKPKREK